jgi:tubulysin polyketide synthase-like protein/HEAT repeat protein
MTAHELLSQLRAKGVELNASGDGRLVIDAPKGTITEELRSALAANKAELIEMLKQPSVIEPSVADEFTVPLQPEAPQMFTPPPAESAEESRVDDSVAEEVAQLERELMQLRTEEEARRAEVETARLASENALRVEQEQWRKQEEEIARRRAEHERQRISVDARELADEEKRREIADQEIRRAEDELERMRAMEDARRVEVIEQAHTAKASHEAQLGALRQVEEEQARRRANEERQYLETEAKKRAHEEEQRRRAEMRFRAIEEEVERVQAREQARIQAEHEAQRLAEEAERRRAEEDARRQAEEQARLRAEEETRLRAEIEAQLRAEADERRRLEDEARRVAEEEARRRAEEQAQLLAAERARRLAEEEAQRRAEEEARRQAEEAARLQAEEEARQHAAKQARLQAEQEQHERAETVTRERAELEARIRAEIEAKIQAEEDERRRSEEGTRRRAEHERIVAEEATREASPPDFPFEIERSEVDDPVSHSDNAQDDKVTEIAEWFEVGLENRKEIIPVETFQTPSFPEGDFGPEDAGSEFQPVSVPEESFAEPAHISGDLVRRLKSSKSADRAAAISDLPQIGGEDAFRTISAAFDDQSAEVRSAAARALFDLQEDRAAAFTRALREAAPERRRKIGSAIATSGLANEAIRNLTGESRDKTYDAFSLLFLMSKAGEVQPLMRAIEEHPNIDVRLAVVKLLALSGQPDILPAFRRMAVRGSLPPEVRSAVMEAIYQISSQSPAEATSMQ